MRRHNIQRVPFMVMMMCAGLALAMSTAVQPSQAQQRQDAELQRATTEFKSNLEQLLTLYEGESKRAEAQLAKVKELLAQGLVTRSELETAEKSATRTREKVAEAQAQFKSADVLIAEAMVEAEAEESTRKVRPIGDALSTRWSRRQRISATVVRARGHSRTQPASSSFSLAGLVAHFLSALSASQRCTTDGATTIATRWTSVLILVRRKARL